MNEDLKANEKLMSKVARVNRDWRNRTIDEVVSSLQDQVVETSKTVNEIFSKTIITKDNIEYLNQILDNLKDAGLEKKYFTYIALSNSNYSHTIDFRILYGEKELVFSGDNRAWVYSILPDSEGFDGTYEKEVYSKESFKKLATLIREFCNE